MAIPTYDSMFLDVLAALDGQAVVAVRDIRAAIANSRALSEAEQNQLLPSGMQKIFGDRVSWSITYLCKAGLVERAAYAKYRITAEGRRALTDCKTKGLSLDLKYLDRYESFRQFNSYRSIKKETGTPSAAEAGSAAAQEAATPQEMLDKAYNAINSDLQEELLRSIMDRSPDFFEKLVVQLLMRMGYGGARQNAGNVVGKTGDEGIDGVINEDKLGFSSIYIQAKRWGVDTPIGRPEIQKFVGALVGQGAQKGLFITKARFTQEALNYAAKQTAAKVVLVDGGQLARLMIEHDVGVSTQCVYPIKRLDMDFFSDDAN